MLVKGCLFGMLGSLAGLVLVVLGVDVAARHYATARIESRVKSSVPAAQGVHARIHSFPFLKVVANGHIDEIGVHVNRLPEQPVTFTDVDVDVHTVRLPVGQLLTGGTVQITHLARGTITAWVTPADLTTALGVPISVDPTGQLTAAGRPLVLVVDNKGHRLVVGVPGFHLVVLPLPSARLLPCPPQVAMVTGKVELSCTFTQIPPALGSLVGAA